MKTFARFSDTDEVNRTNSHHYISQPIIKSRQDEVHQSRGLVRLTWVPHDNWVKPDEICGEDTSKGTDVCQCDKYVNSPSCLRRARRPLDQSRPKCLLRRRTIRLPALISRWRIAVFQQSDYRWTKQGKLNSKTNDTCNILCKISLKGAIYSELRKQFSVIALLTCWRMSVFGAPCYQLPSHNLLSEQLRLYHHYHNDIPASLRIIDLNLNHFHFDKWSCALRT